LKWFADGIGMSVQREEIMGKISKKETLLIIGCEFLEAITSNDLSRLPLSSRIRVTENGKEVKLGAGAIWGAPRRIPCRQTFVDPQTESVVFFGVVTNTSTVHSGLPAIWWLYSARIRIENAQIVEIEEIITDHIFAHYDKKPWEITPNAAYRCVLPEDERVSREEMMAIVECYWNAVERSIDGYSLPFHPDAVRSECGTVTTDALNFPNSARGDFIKASNAGWRWDVLNRRYPIVDVERGVVVSFAELRMTENTNPDFLPCIVAEAFKIESGLIKDLNAMFYAGENQANW